MTPTTSALLRPLRVRAGRISLRRALLGGAVGLTAVALGTAGVAGVLGLRAYLLDRTDDQLQSAAVLAAERSASLTRAVLSDAAPLRAAIAPSDYVVELRHGADVVRFSGGEDLPVGALVDQVPVPAGAEGRPTRAVTVSGHRAVAVRSAGVDIVVAVPLDPVRQTVRRLALVELAAGGVVLTLLSVLARILLTHQLRPLQDVTATATAIAAGRLDSRVPETVPQIGADTEVGRLTAAVNGMLGRIESALTAEQRSRDRLRQFVADASHELRTPMTSIQGYVHLLRRGMVAPTDVPDALRRVDDEAARMAALVDDLLHLARWDSARDRTFGDVDLVPVVRDSIADALVAQPGRPVHWEAPERCLVHGDEGGLRQVLANLLANVRAHTPPEAAVTVRLDLDGRRARLTLSDTGPGMPPALAARAFQRFVRGERTPHGPPGTGLGLAIVEEIIAGHDGTVRLDSAPGRGTTVRIELPALVRHEADRGPARPQP